MRVSSHAFAPICFVTIIPALLIFALFAAIYATRHRNGKKLTVTFTAISSVYSIACVVLYRMFVPSGSLRLAPKIVASIITLAAEMFAASLVMRSDEFLPCAPLPGIGIPWPNKFRGLTLSASPWFDTDESRMRFAAIRDTYDVMLFQTVNPGTAKRKK